MKTNHTFPNDDNGDVLSRMQESGDNLDAPRDINFSYIFETESNAGRFAAKVADLGYKAKASRFEEIDMWQVETTNFMVPTHAGVTDLETRLTNIAAEDDGEPDGWGCFEQG